MSKSDYERIIEDGIPLDFFLLNCPTIYSLWIICSRTSSTQLKIELPCYVICASVFTCTNCFGKCTLYYQLNVAFLYMHWWKMLHVLDIYICYRMKLTVQVVLLCALMKNVSCTQYICSRMQLTESSFSMCVDEKCCMY